MSWETIDEALEAGFALMERLGIMDGLAWDVGIYDQSNHLFTPVARRGDWKLQPVVQDGEHTYMASLAIYTGVYDGYDPDPREAMLKALAGAEQCLEEQRQQLEACRAQVIREEP